MVDVNEAKIRQEIPFGHDVEGSAEQSRVLWLECRVEMLEASLAESRGTADRAWDRLASAARREVEHSRLRCDLQGDLADAQAEILELRRRLERSEAQRRELECRLNDSDSTPEARALADLRDKHRSHVKDRIITNLRQRLEEVCASRERLFGKITDWQRIVRDDEDATSLAEFIAELRAEILSLEGERAASEEREEALRESLLNLGMDPDAPSRDSKLKVVSLETQGTRRNERSSREPLGSSHCNTTASSTVEQELDETRSNGASSDGVGAEGRTLRFEATELEQRHRKEGAAVIDGPSSTAGVRSEDLPRDAPVSSRSPSRDAHLDSLRTLVVAGDSTSRLNAARRLLAIEGDAASPTLAIGLAAAREPSLRAAFLVLLGRSRDPKAIGAVRAWVKAEEAVVRSAAYEAACRLLDGRGEDVKGFLRAGLSDSDPMVRRRSVLAAATLRSVACRPLLEPLKADPDAQVRRLVRQVLAKVPPAQEGETEDPVLALTVASTRAMGML